MNTKPTRILIVDDDVDIRANISDILSDLGYEIELAADADSALSRIGVHQSESNECGFDLCLLDFKMPGMNGAELFQRIHQECPKVRAIMITAFAGEDGVQQALDAGTWRVLRKPVDVDSLLGLIREATS